MSEPLIPIDHEQLLSSIPGVQGDYLEADPAIVWFRLENEDGAIQTELIELDGEHAVFKATVWKVYRTGAGGTIEQSGCATAYGHETLVDPKKTSTQNPDFPEKAETKAVRRALRNLGYSEFMVQTIIAGGVPDRAEREAARERKGGGGQRPRAGNGGGPAAPTAALTAASEARTIPNLPQDPAQWQGREAFLRGRVELLQQRNAPLSDWHDLWRSMLKNGDGKQMFDFVTRAMVEEDLPPIE